MKSESDRPRLRGRRMNGGRGTPESSALEVREYLSVLRRRWWVIVAAGLLALGAAWWTESGKVPVYTAEVLMEQQRQTPLVGMGLGSSGDFVSQIEVIRGRAVASEVVAALGLQLTPRNRVAERSAILDVVETDKGLAAVLSATSPMQEGDKLSNRYGGKGIVRILPDAEMPRGGIATLGGMASLTGPDLRSILGLGGRK